MISDGNTARFLKYVWPLYNIMHERVKVIKDNIDGFANFDKAFKNGPSKIFGRQPLKNFTWSILEHFVSYVRIKVSGYDTFT